MNKLELKTQARECFQEIQENLTQARQNLSQLRKTFALEYAETIRDLCSEIIDQVDGELLEILNQYCPRE